METKVAIVTGGSRGIGKMMVEVLLKKGYKVVNFDINEVTGKQTAEEFTSQFGSGSCVFYKCDVTDSQQLRECYAAVEKDMGSVSVVVNNAGVGEDDWKQTIDVNLKAVVDLTLIAVEKMRKDKGGKGGIIVNQSSAAGMISSAGFPVYAATKWGVIGFTTSMQASLALAEEDWGISLLTLCPSYVETELTVRSSERSSSTPRPYVPQKECGLVVRGHIKKNGFLSNADFASAFDTLITDNKRGSVMYVGREDGSTEASYVEQKYTEVPEEN